MRTNKFLALAALATLMASCSNEDQLLPEENLKDTPMTFTVGVGDMVTRAGYDNTNLPDHFYVNIDQEGTEYDYAWVKMTKNDDNSYSPTEGTTLLWGSSTRNAKIEAYCGYHFSTVAKYGLDELYNRVGGYSLDDNRRGDLSTEDKLLKADYLGACSAVSGDITINGGSVVVNFRHLLSKLDVTYSWGDELASVTDKRISGVSCVGFGTLFDIDLNTGEVEPRVSNGQFVVNEYPFLGSAYLNGLTSEYIFPPYVKNPKLTIGVVIDGEYRAFYVNVPMPAEGLQQGCRYTLNVCIGGKSATVGSVSIAEGWKDTSISHGGFEIQ